MFSGGLIYMVPDSGFIRSHSRESSVDLPQPDGPTIEVKLPGSISKERSLPESLHFYRDKNNICDPEIELIPIDCSHTMVNIIYENY